MTNEQLKNHIESLIQTHSKTHKDLNIFVFMHDETTDETMVVGNSCPVCVFESVQQYIKVNDIKHLDESEISQQGIVH